MVIAVGMLQSCRGQDVRAMAVRKSGSERATAMSGWWAWVVGRGVSGAGGQRREA